MEPIRPFLPLEDRDDKVVRARRSAIRDAIVHINALAEAHKNPVTNPKGCVCGICATADKLRYAEVHVSRMDLFTSDAQLVEYRKWQESVLHIFNAAALDVLDVVESANRYCGDSCCPHRPAVTITTQIGKIDFWLRKRVSVINWEKVIGGKSAEELFVGTSDTHGGREIHCWDYDTVTARLIAVRKSTGY